MYRRRNIFFNDSNNSLNEEKKEQDETIEDLNDKIKKKKNNKRLELLKQFLESNAKYDDEEYTLFTDFRKRFKEYCYNLDKNNLNNMSYYVSKEELLNYNDKYRVKYYSFCRSCKQRYRFKCCEENNRLNRGTKEVILYMKLKN